MSTYDQEIYKFLTEEENFKNMCSLEKHYAPVKKNLLIEFWKEVRKIMYERIEQENLSLSIQLTHENIFVDITKIMVFKNDMPKGNDGYPILAIAMEQLATNDYPFIGLFLNNYESIIDRERVRNRAAEFNSKNFSMEFTGEKSDWYPFWKYLDIKFSTDDDYIQILPANRDALVKSIADKAIDLAIKCEDLINELILMKK